MFTLEQIKNAHAKVKSGKDFPAYVQELIDLGVSSYKQYVADGHTSYSGMNNFLIESPAKYADLQIADMGDALQLKQDLQTHQGGGSDYLTFCKHAADAGVAYWTLDMDAMTCTYYDKKGNSLVEEAVPKVAK